MPDFRHIDQNQILQWVDTGLLIAFIVFLAGFFLAFLRGLLRGWKQGTYRIIFLGTMATVLLCLLPVFANVVGDVNLAQWIQGPIEVTMDGRSFQWEIGTVFQSGYNFVYGLLHDIYQVKASPDAIANYSIALAGSVIRLVLVFVIAFVTETIGALLCWILWHAAFKHFIKKEKRKPKLRPVSGLEEVVTWFTLAALTIIPFTGIANALHNNGSLPQDSDNDTINFVNRILDTYDNSIFNKAVFAWTKGSGKDTIDTQIAEFFAANTYTTEGFSADANFITELRVLAGLEDGLVQWLFAPSTDEGLVTAVMSTSARIGESLYTVAQTQNPELFNEIIPLTFDVARNADQIEGETSIDPTAMKAAYRRIENAEFVSTIEDITKSDYALAAYDEICPYGEATLETVRREIEANPESKQAVNAVISGYVLGQAEQNLDWASGTIASFLPTVDGHFDEEAIAQIDWWDEANIFYDVQKELKPFLASSSNSDPMAELGDRFLKALARDPLGLIELLVGARDASGEPVTDAKGRDKKKACLLDSDLVTIFLPASLEVGTYYLSESVLDENDPDITPTVGDIATELTGSSNVDTRVNFKRELGAVLDVVGKVADTETGKAFIRDFQSHPGLDFAADGTLINLSPDIAASLMGGIKCVDSSRLLTYLTPVLGDHFMRPLLTDGALAEMGITKVDFHCPQLGHRVADLLSIGVHCSEMISSLGSLFKTEGGSGTNFSLNSIIDTINTLETEEGHYQMTHLFDIFTSSPILNPEIESGGVTRKNQNITALLNYLFSSMQLDEPIEISPDLLADTKMASGWKNGDELDMSDLGENYFILRAFKELVDPGSGVFALLTELSGASATKAISALSHVDVATLFDKIGDSYTMRSLLPKVFDKFLIGTLMNSDNDMDLKAMGITYQNLITADDWHQEGQSMQAILDLATRGLDISKLDFFSPSVIKLLKRLSQSMMFYSPVYDGEGNLVKDGDGNVVREYVFSRFVEDKMLLSLQDKSALELFVDYPESSVEIGGVTRTIAQHLDAYSDWAAKESLDRKKALCTVFVRALRLMDTPEEWDEEFTGLGKALNALAGVGGLDGFNTLDSSTIPSLRLAISTINETNAFGPVIVNNVLYRALNSSDLPAEIRSGDTKPNVGWYYRNAKAIISAKEGLPTSGTLDDLVAERHVEIVSLMNLVSVMLGNDAIRDEHGNFDLSFSSLDVDAFLRPVLLSCCNSKVFNPTSPSDMYTDDTPVPSTTVFENLVLVFLKNSGVYVDHSDHPIEDLVTPVKGSVLSLNGIVESINDWEAEIENACELVLLLQNSIFLSGTGELDMSALEDLETYFARPGAKEELAYLINGIQNSALFYRCLPAKLDSAINTGLSGLGLANIEDDLRCADFFYSKTPSGDDLLPYDEAEVNRLVTIFERISNCMGIDLTDLDSVETLPLVEALREMGCSKIFNSNKTKSAEIFGPKGEPLSRRSGMTAYQTMLCDIVLIDALRDYYYLDVSPKDIARAALYSTPQEKIIYTIPTLLPALSDEGMTPAKVEAAAQKYIVEEWGDVLNILKQKQFTDFISGALKFEDLSEHSFATLLHTLNDCTFYRDCVANAFYDALIVKNTIDIEGVDLGVADVFFSYYYYDGTGSTAVFAPDRRVVPNFDMPFYSAEIDHIAMLYSLLKENKDAMSDLNLSTIDAVSIRNVLLELHDSYVFHEAAKDARHPMDFTGAEKKFHDLTVFEQFMYKVCVDTTLFDNNYNPRSDYLYAKAYGEYGAYYKMHDRIMAITGGEDSWLHQIEALTTDGLHHSGDDSDPIVGIVAAGKASGIFTDSSTVGVDFDVLKKASPKMIKGFLYALNEFTLLPELLPNAVGNLLDVNDEGKGIGLNEFSTLERVYGGYVGATELDLGAHSEFFLDKDFDKPFQGVSSVVVPMASNPTGHYTVTLADDTDVTVAVPVKFKDGKATFATNGLPQGFKFVFDAGYAVTGDVIVSVELAKYNVGHDTYRDQSIVSIGHLLGSAYRGPIGGDDRYFSFSDDGGSTLQGFFDDVSEYQHSTYGLLDLFGNSGFYDRKLASDNSFTSDSNGYTGGAYSLYNALNFEVSVDVEIAFDIPAGPHIALPGQAEISIGDRIGQGTTSTAHIKEITAIFNSMDSFADYVREARWFDNQAGNAGTFDVYNSYQRMGLDLEEVGGVSIDNPIYRYFITKYTDQAFAQTHEAVAAMQGVLTSRHFDYSIVVPDGDGIGEQTLYEETGIASEFGTSIIANLLTSLIDNKADTIDLDYAAPTVTSLGGTYKYTRLGDHTQKVALQPELFDDLVNLDPITHRPTYANLTDAYIAEASDLFSAMELLYVTPGDLTPANINALRGIFETLGGEALKLTDIFYVASLYERMMPSIAYIEGHGFYNGNTLMGNLTDFPDVGLDGSINGVATPWSYAAIATTIA